MRKTKKGIIKSLIIFNMGDAHRKVESGKKPTERMEKQLVRMCVGFCSHRRSNHQANVNEVQTSDRKRDSFDCTHNGNSQSKKKNQVYWMRAATMQNCIGNFMKITFNENVVKRKKWQIPRISILYVCVLLLLLLICFTLAGRAGRKSIDWVWTEKRRRKWHQKVGRNEDERE